MVKRYTGGVIRGSRLPTATSAGMYTMSTAAQAVGSSEWPVALGPSELWTLNDATLLLGLKFNASSATKTGTYTISDLGTATYATSGGIQNTGYLIPGASVGGAFIVEEIRASSVASLNKTYMAWYKGTQTTALSNIYSPSIPIFGATTNDCYWGLGIDNGKIEIANGTHNRGTTSVNTGAWFHLAWSVSSSGTVIGYVNGTQEVTTTINASYPGAAVIAGGFAYSGVVSPSAIDAVQIYSGVLTQSQINIIYTSGAA